MVKSRKQVKEFVKANKKRVSNRNIDGLGGISKELDKVYNEYRADKITEVQARTLTYVLRSKALTEKEKYLDEIDKRLNEIENRIDEKRNK